MNKIHVLLVEDETTLAMIVKDTLDTKGFDVTIANDGFEGLEAYAQSQPDIVVADIMMPKMDGFEMMERIRKDDMLTPAIFLTARSDTEDVVKGFRTGANDYLKKPFSMKELIVRIKALVDRTKLLHPDLSIESKETAIAIGKYFLYPGEQTLVYCGMKENLTHRESEILCMLAQQRGEVVATHDILMKLWGDDSVCNANSLQVFITKLRHRLSKDSNVKIINARGVGYKMMA